MYICHYSTGIFFSFIYIHAVVDAATVIIVPLTVLVVDLLNKLID